jgi:hypothetical protein
MKPLEEDSMVGPLILLAFAIFGTGFLIGFCIPKNPEPITCEVENENE